MQTELREATKHLKEGRVIIYPTDTVWGIGCDATNPDAVQKVISIKGRNKNKGLISMLGSLDLLHRYVEEVPEIAYDLMEMNTKPMTLIFDKGKNIAPAVCAPDSSIAIRIPKQGFVAELCYRFQKPIVSTSANFSNSPTPNKFDDIEKKILEKVDYVVDLNKQKSSKLVSTIIKLSKNNEFTLIRK